MRGRDAIEQAAPPHVALVRQLVFDGLSGDEVAMLESFVSRVLSRLDEPEAELRGPDAAAG